jgi:hypothetical protein
MIWLGYVARVKRLDVHKMSFRRQKHMCQSNNLKADLGEIWCDSVNSVQQAQPKVKWRALVNALMNSLVA